MQWRVTKETARFLVQTPDLEIAVKCGLISSLVYVPCVQDYWGMFPNWGVQTSTGSILSRRDVADGGAADAVAVAASSGDDSDDVVSDVFQNEEDTDLYIMVDSLLQSARGGKSVIIQYACLVITETTGNDRRRPETT